MNPKRADNYIFNLLKNGSSPEMNVNGSVTPVKFKYTAPGHSVVVERMLIEVADGGMGWAEFGGLGALLTNGIEIGVYNSSDVLLKDFTDGVNIKGNSDWGLLAGSDVNLADSAVTDLQPIRWTLSKAGHALQLDSGDYIQFTINDDLTGLTKFRAMVQGVKP